MTIVFDMDGTLADLYAVDNWLEKLVSGDPSPYAEAAPMLDLRLLARRLNRLQQNGVRLAVVSWLSKSSTPEYDALVRRAKRRWLATHLPSVDFDEVHIVKHGTYKSHVIKDPDKILFDDEEKNRRLWHGPAYEPNEILNVLAAIL
jgi:hypothetical protein